MPMLILLFVAVPIWLSWLFLKSIATNAIWKARGEKVEVLGYAFFVVALIAASCAVSEWMAPLAAVIGLVAWFVVRSDKKRFDDALGIVAAHAGELAIRKRQLVVKRAYGISDDKKWQTEITVFVNQVIFPAVGRIDVASPGFDKLFRAIEDAATNTHPPFAGFDPAMSPLDYERLVADTLSRLGWEAHTTVASGDQGVDVVATKGGQSIVIQCKLYSKPVGNGAVQEAIAGRIWAGTKSAAVVSNADYTPSARKLASSAGVLLLHHDDLVQLSDMIAGLLK